MDSWWAKPLSFTRESSRERERGGKTARQKQTMYFIFWPLFYPFETHQIDVCWLSLIFSCTRDSLHPTPSFKSKKKESKKRKENSLEKKSWYGLREIEKEKAKSQRLSE